MPSVAYLCSVVDDIVLVHHHSGVSMIISVCIASIGMTKVSSLLV